MDKSIREKMTVQMGDITRVEVDAIVNAANRSLLGGGGVDGAIHRAAGPELLKECRTIGGCPTGEARITGGYRLPARYVIHTVGPVYKPTEEARSASLLSQCYRNSLQLAADHKVGSMAFPAISCGVYGYPIERACRIAIDTVSDFLEGNPDTTLKDIRFVLFSEDDRKVYENYLAVKS
jgi:O-acetyl-ADP-ribose deacetylase (regulator of RNase III)